MDGYAGGSGFASRLRPLGYAVPRLEGLEAPAQTQAHADQAGRSTGRSEEGFTLPQGLLEDVPKQLGQAGLEQHISGESRSPLHEGTLGALQIRRSGKSLIPGHCFFGTAVLRTRTAGGVGAGGVNAPRYPIMPAMATR